MAFDFSESEELKNLRERVREFALREIAPKARALDDKEEFSPDITKAMGKQGLFGMVLPREYGGQGLDYLSFIVAVEELARIDSSQAATVAAHNSLGANPIFYYGTKEQKEKFLPNLCTGDGLWAFALTEPESGSDAQATKTKAVFDDRKKEWIINGRKLWITNSVNELTKGITVQAVTGALGDGRNQLTSFLVPTTTPGLSRKPVLGKMMWRAASIGEVFFEDVRVPEEAVLGNRGRGFRITLETLDNGRLSIGAMGLGLAKGAFDLALDYSKKRKTFGVAIAKHQAVAFKLADMAMRIEAAENLLYKACWLRQNEKSFGKHAAMAKLYCTDVAEFCAREAQQCFGGYGLMKEYAIERHFRDVALLRIGEGTNEIQRMIISRHIGC